MKSVKVLKNEMLVVEQKETRGRQIPYITLGGVLMTNR